MKMMRRLCIILGVFLYTACPVMEPEQAISTNGSFRIPDEIDEKYTVGKIHIHMRSGKLITSIVQARQGNQFVFNSDIGVAEGTPVTFWVEFRDKVSETLYYCKGQDDIITSGSAYDWNIEELYIPIFSESGLRLIGNDPRYLSGEKYVLISDITINSVWTPLCQTTPFTGTFDGSGHTISGVRFNSSEKNIGLFAQSSGACFRHLTIVFSDAEVKLESISTQNFGILAGIVEDTVIERLSVRTIHSGAPDCLPLVKNNGVEFNAGGIVGYFRGNSRITQSNSQIPVSLQVKGNVSVVSFGALIGKVEAVTLSKCYASGNIAISFDTPDCTVNAGGLIGGGRGSTDLVRIEESYFQGDIDILNAKMGNAGGLFGGNTNSLTINRSVVLAKSFYAGFTSTYNANRISGKSVNLSSYIYASVPLDFRPSVSGGTSGLDKPVNDIDVAWFGNQASYGGLEWDFNTTWVWSSVKNAPVFLWD
jgi:hypothetical protein